MADYSFKLTMHKLK